MQGKLGKLLHLRKSLNETHAVSPRRSKASPPKEPETPTPQQRRKARRPAPYKTHSAEEKTQQAQVGSARDGNVTIKAWSKVNIPIFVLMILVLNLGIIEWVRCCRLSRQVRRNASDSCRPQGAAWKTWDRKGRVLADSAPEPEDVADCDMDNSHSCSRGRYAFTSSTGCDEYSGMGGRCCILVDLNNLVSSNEMFFTLY